MGLVHHVENVRVVHFQASDLNILSSSKDKILDLMLGDLVIDEDPYDVLPDQ